MAATRPCLAQLGRLCIFSSRPSSAGSARFLSTTARLNADPKKAPVAKVKGQNPQKKTKKGEEGKKKKKQRSTYKESDMRKADMFTLCDAMRYIRAFEVGQRSTSVKYEVAIRLKSPKNGPVVRNRLRLPHPVKTVRICVICPLDSKYAADAKAAGAVLVGEEEVFDAVKDGRIEFDRCICQIDSLDKMNKAALGRILGPRGLMPSSKMGTVVKDPAAAMRDMVGGAEYRERLGVIRMAIGQLAFTPDEMRMNIKAFIEAVKKDIGQLSDKVNKDLGEVVLSSTNGPGFPLNGEFKSVDSAITPEVLSTA